MSGHNKWTQIKRKKEKTDAQKSKIFGKLARLITEEVRRANGNPDSASVKTAVERAREANMPNENIERAIKKASTESGPKLENVTYEAYGPGGAALIIEALTDNRNRASQEIKTIMSKFGLNLANPGSASWAFKKTGLVWTPINKIPVSEETKRELDGLIEALSESDEVQNIYSNAE